MKFHLLLLATICVLLSSCSSTPKATNLIVEAPNYEPIGEGIKYIALALLGSSVVFGIASMINNGKDDHD